MGKANRNKPKSKKSPKAENPAGLAVAANPDNQKLIAATSSILRQAWQQVWSWIVTITFALIAIGFGVMSMTPPEYGWAKILFVTSALLLTIKLFTWLKSLTSVTRMQRVGSGIFLGSFILGGLLVCLVWVNNRRPIPPPALWSVMLSDVNEATSLTTTATGATIAVRNNSGILLHDVNKIFNFPPIKDHQMLERFQNRLKVVAGGKDGAEFIHIGIPELKPEEDLVLDITFVTPQKITSVREWQQQYGLIGQDIWVYQWFVGKEHKVGEPPY